MNFSNKTILRLCHATILTVALTGLPCMADPDHIQLHETNIKAIKLYQKTQNIEDQWADEKDEMALKYKKLKSGMNIFQNKKEELQNRIDKLLAEQSEAVREISETRRIVNELKHFLISVIEHVEQNLQSGIPFLKKEREERVRDVKKTLSFQDTSLAEKCRRVMETLKIETNYGNTAEVYEEIITIEGISSKAVSVDILRVGRLSLFWRTPDGKITGQWNHEEKKWMTLPGSYRRDINKAMDMALKQRSVELVTLPIGRLIKR